MFGFRKNKPYRVMHYEGIPGIANDIPCTIEIKNDIFTIHLSQDSNVQLPMNRIIKFEAMSEDDFMMKYKGTNSLTQYSVPKLYLVISYYSKESEEKTIVLWAANFREINFFRDLQYNYKSTTGNIEL